MMKSNKLKHFIKDVLPVGTMKEGVDFEVISFFVWDSQNDGVCTIDHYYNFDSSKLLSTMSGGGSPIQQISKEIEKETGISPTHLFRTPFPESPAPHFYRIKSPIDYHTAISLGFGIVRLLKSTKENDYLLYYAHTYLEDLDDELIENCVYEEIGLLKCYLLLTESGRFYDAGIVNFLEEYMDVFYTSLPAQPYNLVERILMHLEKYKGELVVFPKV
jgi:hypothetical protein